MLIPFISKLKIFIQLYGQGSHRKSCIAQIEKKQSQDQALKLQHDGQYRV